MSKKYQIFISSTYEDLKNERDQVIKSILEMGHIPVGMEMFSAADEEQWKIIARQIDESDYYVAIVAHRYGSVVRGVSYTEKEYNYAVQQGVPVLGFIIQESTSWPSDQIDKDQKKVQSLISFKDKIKRKPVGFWESAEDLYGKVSIALMKQITANPRPGWVRTSDVPGPEVILELSRLSSENAKLKMQIDATLNQVGSEKEDLIERTIKALQNNFANIDIWKVNAEDWSDGGRFSLFDMFISFASEMQVEMSTEEAAINAAMLSPDVPTSGSVHADWPVPANHVFAWLSDFVALDLIEPSKRKHSVHDKKQYWALTDFGRDLYRRLCRNRLERASEPDNK